MSSDESHQTPLSPEAKSYSTRRDFLLKVGVALNAVAGLMIGIPVIGFICSTLIKKTSRMWVSLGPVTKFAEGSTILVAYQTPYGRPADGPTKTLTCWVRRMPGDKFRIFAANAAARRH